MKDWFHEEYKNGLSSKLSLLPINSTDFETPNPNLTSFTLLLFFTIMSSADDQYEQKNDVTGGDIPAGDAVDNDYKSRTGQSHIPVQSDEAPVADPIDPATADSDETLGTPPSFSRPLVSVVIHSRDITN